MLISQASSEVANHPRALRFFVNFHLLRAAQNLFVKRIGDQFTNSMSVIPSLQNLLDIEVKQTDFTHIDLPLRSGASHFPLSRDGNLRPSPAEVLPAVALGAQAYLPERNLCRIIIGLDKVRIIVSYGPHRRLWPASLAPPVYLPCAAGLLAAAGSNGGVGIVEPLAHDDERGVVRVGGEAEAEGAAHLEHAAVFVQHLADQLA